VPKIFGQQRPGGGTGRGTVFKGGVLQPASLKKKNDRTTLVKRRLKWSFKENHLGFTRALIESKALSALISRQNARGHYLENEQDVVGRSQDENAGAGGRRGGLYASGRSQERVVETV